MEAGGFGTKLRPKVSTSVSIGDSWWEESYQMALFFKLLEDPTFGTSKISLGWYFWEEFPE